MKKNILSSIFIVACIAGNAQIQYGGKAGLNIATWKGEHADDIGKRKSHLHIHAGVLVNIPITNQIKVQPELLYSGEGVKYDFYYVDADRQKFGYLNIPVLVQYNHPLGFFAETGPRWDYYYQPNWAMVKLLLITKTISKKQILNGY